MKVCSVCGLCFDDIESTCHGELIKAQYAIDVIDGSRLIRAIGSTSATKTFEAQHVESGQACVITIAQGDTESFLTDARGVATIFHPGITAVIESGKLADDSAFAVFEGVGDRSPLTDLISSQSLSLLDQIVIARQTAEAVHALHVAGLVHGAIRPENVSVGGLGTDDLSVKLRGIDLGGLAARSVLANRFAMDSGLGVIKYFAPERLRIDEVGQRSDVYSLGLLLYELLSGHAPFDGDSAAALIDQHVNQRPPEIKIENFDLRMLLTHTLSESLQKQPSFRQGTADLFARQMRHIEQLATHVPTPPPVVAVAAPVTPIRVPVAYEAYAAEVETPLVAKVGIPEPPQVVVQIAAPEPAPQFVHAVAEPTTEQAEPLIQSVALADPIPFVAEQTKRSRLKGMKRKLHSRVSDLKASVVAAPTLINWVQPEDDNPSMEAVQDEISREGLAPVFMDDEEITLVRPVERIEVIWNGSTRQPEPAIADEYFPSLASQKRDSQTANASMFSGYQSKGRDLERLPVYAVGAFAMVLIGFGFFRLASALSDDNEGYIGEYRPTPIQATAPVVRPEPVAQTSVAAEAPSDVIVIPAAIQESDTEPQVVVPVKAKTEDSSPSKAVVKESIKEPSKPTRAAESEPAPIVVGRRSTNATPIVPSTIVITRGEKPRSTVVAGKSTPKGNVIVVGAATRPRIVSVPD